MGLLGPGGRESACIQTGRSRDRRRDRLRTGSAWTRPRAAAPERSDRSSSCWFRAARRSRRRAALRRAARRLAAPRAVVMSDRPACRATARAARRGHLSRCRRRGRLIPRHVGGGAGCSESFAAVRPPGPGTRAARSLDPRKASMPAAALCGAYQWSPTDNGISSHASHQVLLVRYCAALVGGSLGIGGSLSQSPSRWKTDSESVGGSIRVLVVRYGAALIRTGLRSPLPQEHESRAWRRCICPRPLTQPEGGRLPLSGASPA